MGSTGTKMLTKVVTKWGKMLEAKALACIIITQSHHFQDFNPPPHVPFGIFSPPALGESAAHLSLQLRIEGKKCDEHESSSVRFTTTFLRPRGHHTSTTATTMENPGRASWELESSFPVVQTARHLQESAHLPPILWDSTRDCY